MKNIFFAQAQGSRKEQQDFFGEYVSNDPIFIDHGGRLAIVADGMGGLEKGADASKIAVHSFIDSYKAKRKDESIPDTLKRSVISANKAVYKFSTDEGLSGKTGSTLVALVQCKNEVYWLSVGDSRIYQISNNKLKQLSTDHNYENDLLKLVEKGELTLEDVRNNSQKAALTSYIGSESIAKIDQNTQPVIPSPKDVFMLASDGLYARLTDEEITSIVLSDQSNEAAKKLIKCKLEKKLKNQDNLTVSLVFQAKPVQKSKTKKMIAIWMMLFLLPLVGASILFEDLFFYNYFKSKIINKEPSKPQSEKFAEDANEIIPDKEVLPDEESSKNIISETLLAPPEELMTEELPKEEIIQQAINLNEIDPKNDLPAMSQDKNSNESTKQENQSITNQARESISTQNNEEELIAPSQSLSDDKEIEIKVLSSEEIGQINIPNALSQENKTKELNDLSTVKNESKKTHKDVEECTEINTAMGLIPQCKTVRILDEQSPIKASVSASPRKKSCRKADEKLGSQNRFLPLCRNEQ